ncbi:hypothetical protein AB0M68_03770 [Streptomyces sp. NPDC051453]|uniref:hypothetical protein n=1 Tax=Streptomyces sp. NPDC051453 TaxID=3154941 RepID=UPI00342EDC14
MNSLAQLLHLVDRAERGVILPAEAAQLRIAIRAMHSPAAHDSNRVWLTRSAPSDQWRPVDFKTTLGELVNGRSFDTVRAVFQALGQDVCIQLDGGPQQHPAHDEPTVAECAANDRRWWNGEKAGEGQ